MAGDLVTAYSVARGRRPVCGRPPPAGAALVAPDAHGQDHAGGAPVLPYGATCTWAVPGGAGTPGGVSPWNTSPSDTDSCPFSGTVMVTGVLPPITTPVMVTVEPSEVQVTSPRSGTAPV